MCLPRVLTLSVCVRLVLSTAGLNGRGGAGRRWITLRLSQARGLIGVEAALCLTQHVRPPVNAVIFFFSFLPNEAATKLI